MVNSSKVAIGTWLRFYEYIYPDLSTEEFFIKDAYNYIGSNKSFPYPRLPSNLRCNKIAHSHSPAVLSTTSDRLSLKLSQAGAHRSLRKLILIEFQVRREMKFLGIVFRRNEISKQFLETLQRETVRTGSDSLVIGEKKGHNFPRGFQECSSIALDSMMRHVFE